MLTCHPCRGGSQQRCSADHAWLQEQLAARGIKAYLPTISVTDPKQRKPANEVVDWCAGEGIKMWSVAESRYVPSISLGGKRLQSVPTQGPLA